MIKNDAKSHGRAKPKYENPLDNEATNALASPPPPSLKNPTVCIFFSVQTLFLGVSSPLCEVSVHVPVLSARVDDESVGEAIRQR